MEQVFLLLCLSRLLELFFTKIYVMCQAESTIQKPTHARFLNGCCKCVFNLMWIIYCFVICTNVLDFLQFYFFIYRYLAIIPIVYFNPWAARNKQCQIKRQIHQIRSPILPTKNSLALRKLCQVEKVLRTVIPRMEFPVGKVKLVNRQTRENNMTVGK